ncbi:ABC transporter G family member 23-like isoform X2 [Sipha flava]|uniref:ABC transporter G family member 23 n=1 Tax=Sipha flava TaxID=143950 RepID=A0A2S2Q182_9HEMI|nr:ABC transporter G family member 23-like isoform X2 [Sipha flava]
MNQTCEYAVTVKNAYKTYAPDFQVLNGVNMKIPKGSIYGLLGPSGCGKTTLLSCIVGRLRLDSGDIKLKGKLISDIGYMPQELALHNELSIKETFTYYGYIFNLSDDAIKIRRGELKTLLKLPSCKLILNEISGGQQRRVSLAVAMLHDPKLLILDEPTVGLDPLISQSIWDLLLDITEKEGKTVIITTHYIEEARQSQMIGLMRKGVLLAEETPSELLRICNCSTLEDAFLKICEDQKAKTDKTITAAPLPVKQPTRRFSYARDLPPPPLLNNKLFTFGRFKAQVYKNINLLRRNIPFTLFVTFLPLIQTGLFNIACGHDPKHLALGVFNEDFNTSVTCSMNRTNDCFLDGGVPVGCLVLERLKEKTFDLVEFSNVYDGEYAVKKSKVWGFIHFSKNFSDNLAIRFNNENSDISDQSNSSQISDETYNFGSIHASIDNTNKYLSDMIKRDILDSYMDVVTSLFNKCKKSEKLGKIPLRLLDPVYGNKNPSFIHYATPAIISLCAFYLPAIYTGATILSEKEGGVIERVVLSGMNFIEIALAQVLVQTIFIVNQTTLVMTVMFAVFDNPFVGDIFPSFFLLTLIGCGGMCFGLFSAIICKTTTEAAFLGIGTNFLLKFLCGLMWPTEGMYYWLRKVSDYLPLTKSTESLRSLTAKGLGFQHPTVYLGFLSIFSWILVFSLVSFVMLKLKRDVWTKS